MVKEARGDGDGAALIRIPSRQCRCSAVFLDEYSDQYHHNSMACYFRGQSVPHRTYIRRYRHSVHKATETRTPECQGYDKTPRFGQQEFVTQDRVCVSEYRRDAKPITSVAKHSSSSRVENVSICLKAIALFH